MATPLAGVTGMMVTARVADLGSGSGAEPQRGAGRSPAKKILADLGAKNTDFTVENDRELHPATFHFSTCRPLHAAFSSLHPAACCSCHCFRRWLPRTSSINAMLLARTTARKLLERACAMRTPVDHDALAVLHGVSCASAQMCAAERRLMVSPLGTF